MVETYSFTIPSLQDDTPLDCRIYHPSDLHSTTNAPRGAIIAHPYPPLGGTQDDHVVLALTECLLETGQIVVTFNFRGAGDSAGSNSWTGHAEVHDYVSAVGLLVYYLHHLDLGSNDQRMSMPDSMLSNKANMPSDGISSKDQEFIARPIDLLLGGYSFGALILARLPGIGKMINTIETAERGTSGAEIFLRARALARQTNRALQELRPALTPGTHKRSVSGCNSSPSSSIKVGGEETDPAERRRRSKDLRRRSMSTLREVPRRIRTHIRRYSGSDHQQATASSEPPFLVSVPDAPQVNVRYLLVSPVLFPLSTTLLPPGLGFHKTYATDDDDKGVLSLKSPTFLAFGDSDHFTSAKKLRQWAERLAREAAGPWKWTQVADAGHFWGEDMALPRLEAALLDWIQSELKVG